MAATKTDAAPVEQTPAPAAPAGPSKADFAALKSALAELRADFAALLATQPHANHVPELRELIAKYVPDEPAAEG